MKRFWSGLAVALFLCSSVVAQPEPRPDPLDPSYHHDFWKTMPRDQVREYRAYTTSFDGPDDNDGDGVGDLWGIPEWVSFEMKAAAPHAQYEPRPGTWMTDKQLYDDGSAPRNQSYVRSGYDKGHMCAREEARRLGKDADWNSHNVLNACPQIHAFNDGAWRGLETKTDRWANIYGHIWVIAGPIILDRDGKHTPSDWIGKGKEKKVAIPDKFFKIVVKESPNPNRPDVLAFIYPHDEELNDKTDAFDHRPYLTSVREVEKETGLDFFTSLSQEDQDAIEEHTAAELWPVTAPSNHTSIPSSSMTERQSTRLRGLLRRH